MGNMELPKILIVDDRDENIIALEKVLRSLPVKIITATSGNEALGLVLEHDFALILLDVQMPDMDGFETAELIRSNDDTSRIPIIFVTAISKEDKYVFKGYETGAVDYLFKPIDSDILKGKVVVFMELYRQKAKLKRVNGELKRANRKILVQQRAVIEEERLKVLLQMAGATAHELNQPLMAMLGNIELMELNGTIPTEVESHIKRIKEAGERIASTVRKIQTIKTSDVKPYGDNSHIIDLEQPLKIMSVDTSTEDFERLNAYLDDSTEVRLEQFASIKSAIGHLVGNRYDMILLDYLLEDGTAFDFFSEMEKYSLEVPIVVITGQGDEILASQMIQIGAYDYLPKNRLTAQALKKAIAQTQEKARLKSEIAEAQARMTEMSTKDELTQLSNRRYFNEVLEVQYQRAVRYGQDLILGIIDLDHFKQINDQYGHPAGDQVLIQLGQTLKSAMRQDDLACRYGGEEFAFILPGTDMDQAQIVCKRLHAAIESMDVTYNDREIRVTASIGMATATGTDSSETLLSQADTALYRAKKAGRNRVEVYVG